MISALNWPTYNNYKQSGEYWMEQIPAHWETRKLKHLFREKRHRPNLTLNCGAISFGEVVEKDDDSVPVATKASYQEVLAGEFLVNPLNLNYDLKSLRIGLSEINVVVSAGYIVLQAMDDLDKRYFKYLLHRYDVACMKLLGSGVRQTISFNHIANSILVAPPIPEQRAIAAFLDEKCAKVDEAVRIKEEQIALLRERRQILIQEAVTRGLNPDAPMKDSGIEWLGPIPSHWKLLPLKFIAQLKSGETISSERFTSEGFPVFGGNGFRGYTDAYTHEGDFVLIGRQGALCGNVNYASGRFFASEHAIVATPRSQADKLWLGELIRSANLNRLSQSAAQPGLSVEVVGNQRFPYAPFVEQVEIGNYVEEIANKFDVAIALKSDQISTLKEYKTTLINAAVTGKIKVA